MNHSNLRFEFRHKAQDYRDANGLAGTHVIIWTGRGFRLVEIDKLFISEENFNEQA